MIPLTVAEEIKETLLDYLFTTFNFQESGVEEALLRLLGEGVPFLRERGWATDEDIAHTEAGGRLTSAEPHRVSRRALIRAGPSRWWVRPAG